MEQKSHLWKKKCDFSVWKSLLQSQLRHSYQVVFGVKVLSLTHPAHTTNRDI